MVERIETADVAVTITADVVKQCPVKHETDEGTVTITYRTDGSSFELHSLADYLAGFRDLEISHEDFTALVARELQANVSSAWQTAGMRVTCEDPRVLR